MAIADIGWFNIIIVFKTYECTAYKCGLNNVTGSMKSGLIAFPIVLTSQCITCYLN